MSTSYTPGPWRCVLTDDDGIQTYHIEITEGHIASVFGWSKDGVACPVTQANATLIEHAPDMAAALQDLLGWETVTGGWDAPCWRRAERVLEHATGARSSNPAEPVQRASDMLGEMIPDQGWSEETQLSVLLAFLDAETAHDPVLARRLHAHLQDAIAP